VCTASSRCRRLLLTAHEIRICQYFSPIQWPTKQLTHSLTALIILQSFSCANGIAVIRTSILCDSTRMQPMPRLVVVTLVVATLTNKVVVCWSPPTALRNEERRTFLAEHNRWRSRVQPPPGDMSRMVSESFYKIPDTR